MSNSQTPETYITVSEYAAMARVHPATVKRWIKAGGVPATRFGRRFLIPSKASTAGTTHSVAQASQP